ncbi:hypothetical protein D3C76_1444210 [compost metagenome]
MRLVHQRQAFTGDLAERAGFIDTGDFRPGRVQLAGHQRQQRPGTGDHGTAQGFDHAALDLQLQPAEQHDARQGPTGEGDVALMATGRQQQVGIVDLV